MRKLVLLAAVAVLSIPTSGQTQGPAERNPTPRDLLQGTMGGQTTTGPAAARAAPVSALEFVRNATISDMYEIQSSQLAAQRSQNQQVKQFAQEMVQDHTKTTDELQQLVRQMPPAGAQPQTGAGGAAVAPGATFQVPTQLDPEHQQMLIQLQNAQGAEFDRLYARQQVMAHQDAVDMFRNYSQDGDNPQLRDWAGKTLPDLQDHLQKAQALQRGVSG